MEKYGRFRDARTGIYPFVPFQPPVRATNVGFWLLLAIKRYVVAPPLALLRLLLSLIVFVWLGLMTLLSLLIPIALLRRGFRRYTYALGCRVLLLLLGFWWVSVSAAALKRGKAAPVHQPWSLDHGDVIVCNHVSYIDILYLAFRYAPVFTVVCTDDEGSSTVGAAEMRDGNVEEDDTSGSESEEEEEAENPEEHTIPTRVAYRSLFGALWDAVSVRGAKVSEGMALAEIVKQARVQRLGPVVVFPESTTSNGRCLLQFLPAVWGVSEAATHFLGFKYLFDEFSPSYVAGSRIAHLWRLACQFHNTLQVQRVGAEEAQSARTRHSRALLGAEQWRRVGEEVLGQVLRLKVVQLSIMDKRAFQVVWNRTHSRGYTKQA